MDTSSYQDIFLLQKKKAAELAKSNFRVRRKKLRALRKSILRHRFELHNALDADFKKSASEVDLNEIYPIITEIRFVNRHLKFWMKPRQVNTPLLFKTGKSFILPEPKGQCLIISTWNFPILISFMPLISVVAAGNTAIIKPSEHCPASNEVMEKILSEVFDTDEVSIVQGDGETAKGLLELPFNHIHYTGSGRIGKTVMAAASKHLASVTLELGGKSPAIIDSKVDLDMAAKRIVWSKFMNAGQVCIAPDHVFVHESNHELFLEKLKFYIQKFYGNNPSASEDYARIVHDRHYQELEEMMLEALKTGGQLSAGGDHRSRDNYIGPTVIDEPGPETRISTEEIFGPLLPVYPYRDIDELIAGMQDLDKPLMVYVYSKRKKLIDRITKEIPSGGLCVNHGLVNMMNAELPFGGMNQSGIGKSKGYFGFLDFSNQKAIYKHSFPFSITDILMPPYTKFKKRLINFALRWF